MKDHKTLKTKELFAMMTIFVGMKLADTTPSMLAQKASNAFWIVPLVSFLVIMPSFFLLIYLLKKYDNKNLIGLLEEILGTHMGKIIGFLIFITSFFSLTLDSRNYVEQIKLLYFPESPTAIIYFTFFIVVFFCAKKGFEVIGYTSWIGLPLIKFAMLLLALLILDQAVLQRIFPIFGQGLDNIISEGVKKASIFSELFLFTIAYTALKDTKSFRKGSHLASIVVTLEIISYFLLYTLIFDYKSIDKVAFPFHDITQYVDFGEFFTNVETFFMVFWLLAAFMRFIIFLYLITWIFGSIFNIKEFEPLLLPFAFFTIIIGILPDNSIVNELVLRDPLLNYMTPLFIAFPLILWLVALFKGDLKKT